MKKIMSVVVLITLMSGCHNNEQMKENENESPVSYISEETTSQTVNQLSEKFGDSNSFRIERGVKQVAALWTEKEGSAGEFNDFCLSQFVAEGAQLDVLFKKVSRNLEILWGYFNTMSLALQEPLHLDIGTITPFDQMIGGFSPSSHLAEDLYENKIAFMVALNFPSYTLEEKEELGDAWTPKQWAYARAGDVFTTRVPASVNQDISKTLSDADLYISEYNIYMGYLLNDKGDTLFPKSMKLISHWNLRDELKSDYNVDNGLEKQEMIYSVMLHIINQTIPARVINSDACYWAPASNKVLQGGKEIELEAEPDTRYEVMLNNYRALRKADPFNPQYKTYIQRKFNGEMEMTQPEVEKLFIDFVSSPVMQEIGALISKRLGRELRPFDIWYDGFKSRSSIDETKLNEIVAAKYPGKDAFEAGLPEILTKLDFTPQQVDFITARVQVDPARGAGHAWGAEMKSVKSHLRTRIGSEGMNYKGYNIAVHEFGHNVEQTISLHQVYDYLLHGVPNTAFTEALAFVFQKRDLELLGLQESNPDKKYLDALDITWSTYEIMGVSLVDMNVWKWLYAHPDATAAELKAAVIEIAVDVWNKYYAPVFGVKDSPILAIYSHMIDYPLYLPAYPIGHLIDFQIEQQLQGKVFAKEVTRMFKQGRLSPQLWMKNAVGTGISGQPMLDAAKKALEMIE